MPIGAEHWGHKHKDHLRRAGGLSQIAWGSPEDIPDLVDEGFVGEVGVFDLG